MFIGLEVDDRVNYIVGRLVLIGFFDFIAKVWEKLFWVIERVS